MLKIGDFSRLSRLSIRMLRYYDDLGLLHPDRVDSESGYRYYSEGQLLTARDILKFREMGFGLQTMGDLLNARSDPEQLRVLLQRRQDELHAEREELNIRLRRLENALSQLGKDETSMNYDVTLKEFPQRQVASVRDLLPAYDYEGRLWHTMMKETAGLALKKPENCMTLGIYHDTDFRERDVDVEIQMTVIGSYENTEHVTFKTVPPTLAATATFQGSYDQSSEASAAVAQWASDNGYVLDGPSFAIYHVSPHETQNLDELVTETCWPVKKK